jgi:hypothetical protein
VIFDRPTASVTTLDLDALYALEARTRVDAA